jgi:hypothetical protein
MLPVSLFLLPLLIVRGCFTTRQLNKCKAIKNLDPVRIKVSIMQLWKQPMQPKMLPEGEGDLEDTVEKVRLWKPLSGPVSG